MMTQFNIKKPPITNAQEIEQQSLDLIEKQCVHHSNFANFSLMEKEVIKRLIHTSTQFEDIINHAYFSPDVIDKTAILLKNSASIIVDTNMIKSGLSSFYTKKYNNEVICHVQEERVKKQAEYDNTTRSYAAVKQALLENHHQPVILACGNAPTFLYSAVETLVTEDWPPENLVIWALPIGFINVVESKTYILDFLNHFSIEGMILKGRYGGSALVVSCLHAIYKLIS